MGNGIANHSESNRRIDSLRGFAPILQIREQISLFCGLWFQYQVRGDCFFGCGSMRSFVRQAERLPYNSH